LTDPCFARTLCTVIARIAAAWLIFLVLGAAPPPAAIVVSAAISLTDALEEIESLYGAAGGGQVTFNFGASNALARQIVNGAPVDVFISADEAQMQVVERAGLLPEGGRVALLSNRLAIVVPVGHREPLTSAAALARRDIRHVAIGDPDGVPVGVYARQYLQRVGLWDALQPKLVPLRNARAVLAAAETGAADAAIVYVTDARSARSVRVAAVIDGGDAPSIVYPAAVISSTRRPDAAHHFLRFLGTAPAAAAFSRHGFTPVYRVQ
jgi:molybdate transport system substrate-binding protein